MTLDEFRTHLEEAADLYLQDYPRSYNIEYDLEDPELPRAELQIFMADESAWVIRVSADEYGEIGIESANETFLPLNGESIYATLWLEAMDRLAEARCARD